MAAVQLERGGVIAAAWLGLCQTQGQRRLVWHRIERRVVRGARERAVHRRGGAVHLVQWVDTEDLLDGPDHRDLRVVGVVDNSVLRPWADDLERATVAVDVVNPGLGVVFHDEDRTLRPVLTVRDRVDDLAERQVVICYLSLRAERAN